MQEMKYMQDTDMYLACLNSGIILCQNHGTQKIQVLIYKHKY